MTSDNTANDGGQKPPSGGEGVKRARRSQTNAEKAARQEKRLRDQYGNSRLDPNEPPLHGLTAAAILCALDLLRRAFRSAGGFKPKSIADKVASICSLSADQHKLLLRWLAWAKPRRWVLQEAGRSAVVAWSMERVPDKVSGRFAYNLAAEEPEAQIDELASHAASAGLERFWHLVVSHRPGEELTDEEMEEIRQTIAKVLGVQECPMVWATHKDTEHLHDHGLIVSFLADIDEPIAFGEGWWKEKAQIAIAICEYRLGLEPEPNRRYVADDRGVYHLQSWERVADAEGRLLLDRTAMRTMQRNHDAAVRENEAPSGVEPGSPWLLDRAMKKLAGPAISQANSWHEVHHNLAAIGVRYVKVGNTGVLEAVTQAYHHFLRHDRHRPFPAAPEAIVLPAAADRCARRDGSQRDCCAADAAQALGLCADQLHSAEPPRQV